MLRTPLKAAYCQNEQCMKDRQPQTATAKMRNMFQGSLIFSS